MFYVDSQCSTEIWCTQDSSLHIWCQCVTSGQITLTELDTEGHIISSSTQDNLVNDFLTDIFSSLSVYTNEQTVFIIDTYGISISRNIEMCIYNNFSGSNISDLRYMAFWNGNYYEFPDILAQPLAYIKVDDSSFWLVLNKNPTYDPTYVATHYGTNFSIIASHTWVSEQCGDIVTADLYQDCFFLACYGGLYQWDITTGNTIMLLAGGTVNVLQGTQLFTHVGHDV